jgi:Flp pilus assembly protein TadG
MKVRDLSRIFRSACRLGRRLGRDQSGSALSFVVLVPVVMGAAAVGVETGQAYRTKRQMQSASDAAALAGSIDRMAGKDLATITATAQYEAQRNGFQNGTGGVTVTVNAPPTSGANVGTTGAVEVVIGKSQSFSLGAAIINWMGGSSSSFTMHSRSVAAQGTYTSTTTTTTTTSTGDGCLVALTTDNEQGVSFTSFNNFNADCMIYSNGSATGTGSTTASIYMGSFNNATLKSVWTRGSFTAASYYHITYTGTPNVSQNQTTTVNDPYSSLPTPSPGTCSYNSFSASSQSSVTLSPGTYCGGLSVTSVTNVYFTPGIYYVANGDLYLSSVNNVTCPTCSSSSGVTIILTQTTGNNSDIGGVRISSDNNVALNATASGTWAGILFYQDRRVANGTMSSTSKIFTVSSLNTANLTGAIYFPNNRIDISSLNNNSNNNDGCTVWVGRYIKFSSYNNNWIAGCNAAGLINRPGILTTTTTTSVVSSTKGKIYE